AKRIRHSEHVRIRTNAGIAEQIPGAADRCTIFKNDEGLIRALFAKVMGGGDAGQPGSHNQNVEMFKRHSYRRAAAPSAASILGFRTDKFAFANATFAGEAMTFALAGMPLAASKAMRSAGTPTMYSLAVS